MTKNQVLQLYRKLNEIVLPLFENTSHYRLKASVHDIMCASQHQLPCQIGHLMSPLFHVTLFHVSLKLHCSIKKFLIHRIKCTCIFLINFFEMWNGAPASASSDAHSFYSLLINKGQQKPYKDHTTQSRQHNTTEHDDSNPSLAPRRYLETTVQIHPSISAQLRQCVHNVLRHQACS